MTKLDHYLTTDRDGEDAAYLSERLWQMLEDKFSGMDRSELDKALGKLIGTDSDMRCAISERCADLALDEFERFVEGL